LEVRWRGDDGVVVEEVFDADVVCIGRNTVPLVPNPRCLLLCLCTLLV
jgi:hypothetical protein